MATHLAATALARRAASGADAPRSRPARKTPVWTSPAVPVDAVDTTGAGDVHTGAFLAGLLRGASAVEAARRANAVAARWVATGSYGG